MKRFIFIILMLCIPSLARSQAADAPEAISYLSNLSTKIVHRPLTSAELTQLQANGADAMGNIVKAWFSDVRFIDSAQFYVENLLRANGTSAAANFNLPGNLAREIARRELPYSNLVTASSCFNSSGQSTSCDSGSPVQAGVLTTKAFLITNGGPYNIGRAGKLISKFLCSTYPLPETEEPKIAQADLIDQFATTAGKITFGNGNNCYSCHSQFGHHTQLFIKFDLGGTFRSDADGIQNPAATDGYSTNNTMTSHFKSPARAGSQNSQFLGQSVANIREAALVMSKSPHFLPCAVKNLMVHYLRLPTESVSSIKPGLYKQIAADAQALNSNPSFSHLLISIITNKNVYDSFLQSGVRP